MSVLNQGPQITQVILSEHGHIRQEYSGASKFKVVCFGAAGIDRARGFGGVFATRIFSQRREWEMPELGPELADRLQGAPAIIQSEDLKCR